MGFGEVYSGEFEKGMFHGKGNWKLRNGDSFVGMFERGKPGGKMKATWVEAPFCGAAAGVLPWYADKVDYDCAYGYIVSVLYFVSYQIMGSLVMMNLMVGVVVDNFSNTSTQQNLVVHETAMLEFQLEWKKFDPESTSYIPAHYLSVLICKLLPPIGVDKEEQRKYGKLSILYRLYDAWLPLRDGKVHFQEVLFGLSRTEVGQHIPQCPLRRKLDEQTRKAFDLKELVNEPVLWTAHEFYAAETIQR